MQITCPVCHGDTTRRSRRRTVDYLFSVIGALPWRCNSCEARFYARAVPFHHLLYAHCSICGNLDLQRISGEYVSGPTSLIWRILRLHALRCEPCRHKFFSVRLVRRKERPGAMSSSS